MTGYFVAIILFGSFITVIAMVLIVAEKSRERDLRLDVTERRERLVDVMADAEQLVDELNRFADYSVNACEQKRQEVASVLQRADMLMSQVSAASASLESSLTGARMVAARPDVLVADVQPPAVHPALEAPEAPVRGRVLTLDARRSEALRLAKGGMTHVEIARALHLGKGEIELITRVGSGT